ncbi:unnamed protein product [Peniophora sp. CBMAI 1063]|nr:unnamed protein product [Peniophora sp. CBMAI 1063]
MPTTTIFTPHSLPPIARASMFELLANSVISLTFGPLSALARVFRFIYPAYYADPNANIVPFNIFVLLSGIRATLTPGLPRNSIAFFAYEELKLHPVDTTSLLEPGWEYMRYCIIDMIAENPHLIIPSRLFVPYEGTNRAETSLQRTDMLPVFFFRSDGGVGVRIDSSTDFDMLLDVPTRITAKSLKVVLQFLDYSLNEKQIQLRPTAARPAASSRHLARLVASKVSYLIKDAAAENAGIMQWANRRWRVGSGAGYIGVGDVELLGIVFVSQGKVTPLLRVRSDFVFAF